MTAKDPTSVVAERKDLGESAEVDWANVDLGRDDPALEPVKAAMERLKKARNELESALDGVQHAQRELILAVAHVTS